MLQVTARRENQHAWSSTTVTCVFDDDAVMLMMTISFETSENLSILLQKIVPKLASIEVAFQIVK